MTHVTYTELRQNLARYLDEAIDGRAPVVVTRPGKEPVALVALSELEGWKETVHLLSSPANAEALLESIAQIERGELIEYEPGQPIETARTGRRAAE